VDEIFKYLESEYNYRPLEVISIHEDAAVVKALRIEDKKILICKLSRDDWESFLLKKLKGDHHVIQLLILFEGVELIGSFRQMMVLPYYRRTLNSECHKKFAPHLMKQLFEAIRFCHTEGIIHRDIKMSNILVSENNELVLADFGLACLSKGEKQTDFCGTLEYMAPEIVLHQSYSFPVDIWSVGMTFHELLTGSQPLQSFTKRRLSFLFKKWKKEKTRTLQLKALSTCEYKIIRKMLCTTPRNRPTIEQINYRLLHLLLKFLSNNIAGGVAFVEFRF